ncbi:integrase/recombinase XerD [Laceyella sediminis]|uniref:Integrase/recombinase XerD n=1 Tax=Laceyella sediminis TaxID=573074 RepID=A0ABX5ERH0_9BACL|nr:tyrosine-type recombinase/integrase [Laceyella sediminis]PRZ16316.1 integrase/recombinase XerD [Laceyella sediminis]
MSRKGKRIVTRRREFIEPTSTDSDMTIQEAFDYFVNLKKTEGVKQRTINDYYMLMGYFTEWLNEQHPSIERIENINTGTIREYIIYLSEERFNEQTGEYGLSPYTVNVRIRFLKAFFNALYREEIIRRNPCEGVSLMRVNEDTFEPLTDDEIERLLGAPNTREYAQFRDLVIMYLMLDTGMRISEVCNLEVSEIDFKTRAIILPSHKNKNRKPRILPLSNHVLKLLMELVTENKTHFDTNFVFVSNCGTRYNPNSFRKRLLIYKKNAGITKRVSPHLFRHMFCRNYILNGGDVFTLQRIAGHADISTTRKYVQMDDKAIKDQHAQFSPVLRIRKKFK